MADLRSCPACRRSLRDGARFCDGCGHRIEDAAPPAPAAAGLGELRTATILFADLCDFTTMSEELDPDDAHVVVKRVFTITDRTIEGLAGKVEKHMGDAVMGVFGVPRAHEDDAARAIRAGLEIQAAIRGLASELEQEGLPSVVMRVGINTGRIAVGAVREGAAREMSVWGDTVNVASRLQAACPPGSVLVSHETYRQVRGLFEVQAQPPMHVKGKRHPVSTYVVRQEKRGSFIGTREVLGGETHMIGRDREFMRLLAAFERCVTEGRPHTVTVVGAPGLGKSRVLHEYLKHIEASPRQVFLMRGRAAPETSGEPFHLVASVVKASAGIRDKHTSAQARQRLQEWCSLRLGPAPRQGGRREYDPVDPPPARLPYPASYGEEAAHFLGELIGIPFPGSAHVGGTGGDPHQIRQRGYLALRRIVERGTRHAPMVVELEDIQWADTSSLAFFEHLASIVEGPLLLLVAARPELDEIYPQWLRPGSDRTLIDLGPIDAEASVELAEHLLRHVGGIPPELPREIARRSGGTPYFVEEMVKHLSDRGVIVDDGDGLRYGGEMERLREMPPTVEGVLQARLDLLAPPILTACRVAAVVGRTFWDCTLSDLAADAEAPSAGELEPVLEGLVRREIVRPEPTSAFPPCAELTFVHDLMRDVAYRSLVKRDRIRLHLGVARWLERRSGDRIRELLSTIAGHYERGRDLSTATDYYRRAAKVAADRFSNHDAARLYVKAIETGEASGMAVPADRLELARIRERTGDWDAAEREATRCAEAASAAGDAALESRSLQLRARIATIRGQFDRGRALSTAALEAARAAGAGAEEAAALSTLAGALARQGDAEQARSLRETALGIHRRLGQDQAIASMLLGIARSATAPAEAERLEEEALSIFRRHDDKAGIAEVLHAQALRLGAGGRYEAALAAYRDSLDLRQAIGDYPHQAWNLYNMASLELTLGRWDLAERFAEESLAICRNVGNRPGVAYGHLARSYIAQARGDLDAALRHGERSLEVFREVGEIPQELALQVHLADVHRQAGRYRRATECLSRAEEIQARMVDTSDRGSMLSARGELAFRLGDVDAARRAHAEALEDEPEGPGRASLALTLARVEIAAGDVGAARRLVEEAARSAGDEDPALRLSLRSLGRRLAVRDESADGLLEEAQALGNAAVLDLVALDLAESGAVPGGRLRDLLPAITDPAIRLRVASVCAPEVEWIELAARLRAEVPEAHLAIYDRHPWRRGP